MGDVKQNNRAMKNVVLVPAPLLRSPMIDDFCGKPVLIKDCSQAKTSGGFSSGTFKDYRSARLVNDFGGRNPILYSIVYTTAGYSLGLIAKEYNGINGLDESTGIQVVSLIDEKLDVRIKNLLGGCSVVTELPLKKRIFSRGEIREAALHAVKEKRRECIDAENYLHGYTQLAKEILEEQPDIIFMPLGGGEAVNSMLHLLNNLDRSKLNLPRLFAATVRANVFAGETSPGAYSIAQKLVTPWSELAESIKKLLPKFGEIVIVEEDEIMPAYYALKNAGIKAEPSAAVAFAAARKIEVSAGKKILIVNSGCGIYIDPDGILRGVSNGA